MSDPRLVLAVASSWPASWPAALDHRPTVLVLLGLAGVLAGVINTIAGGGSFLTLPLLMALGLPASVANGTNRVGILVQNIAATATFRKSGLRDSGVILRLVLPMSVGSWFGSVLGSRLEDDLLRAVFGWILLGWSVLLVIRPGRFARSPPSPIAPRLPAYLAAVAIGVYGGFLQAGVGFPLTALVVVHLGYEPVRANAIKVALVLIYTGLVALPVFIWAGQVAWAEGAVLAAGNMLGGWAGTHWQLRAGAVLVRWFIVVMVAISGLLMVLG